MVYRMATPRVNGSSYSQPKLPSDESYRAREKETVKVLPIVTPAPPQRAFVKPVRAIG